VLHGQMSLVGPRPLLMEYLDRYTDRQRLRHAVRPGITGTGASLSTCGFWRRPSLACLEDAVYSLPTARPQWSTGRRCGLQPPPETDDSLRSREKIRD
jgi:hypothetical protein